MWWNFKKLQKRSLVKTQTSTGFELVPPRLVLYWVSLTAELQTHTLGASEIYFISIMNCGFIFQPFAIFNTAHAINENACITGNLSIKCFMQI